MNRGRTRVNLLIILAFAAVCIGGIEFLAVNIGQPLPFSNAYSVHAVFSDADGIPTAADVRVAGVDVGKVTDVANDPAYPGETVVTLQITDPTAVPVYSNGYAMIKPKTLLGEKYVELTIGDGATAEPIESGGFLPPAQTGKDVSNDEIFNAFDAKTRAEQQQVLAELDSATFSRSNDIQAILPQLETVVQDLDPVAHVYEQDQPQVDSIFVQLNTIMQTLADEHQQLAGVLSNGNIALSAINQKDQALLGTLQQAADFATDLNNAMAPTVRQQQAAIDQLQPALSAQDEFLNQVVAPQSYCGGKECGIDEVFTGTLLGNINYPNDQLTVSSNAGELVTDEWDSMFSQPQSGDPRALNLTIDFQCDAITQTLNGTISPTGVQSILNELEMELGLPPNSITPPNPCTTLPKS